MNQSWRQSWKECAEYLIVWKICCTHVKLSKSSDGVKRFEREKEKRVTTRNDGKSHAVQLQTILNRLMKLLSDDGHYV